MKELKFRAWDKWKNEYIYNGIEYALRMIEIEHEYKDIPPIGFVEEVDGKRFDVEQFTGLHDKNGNEIYEGDIVVRLVKKDDSYPAQPMNGVAGRPKSREWVEKEVGLITMSPEVRFNDEFICAPLLTLKDHDSGRVGAWGYKIIGNIHENPELLEGK